ncbi:MAG: DUF4340 domain-containing protein [Oscillospiraceae bacterium]|nr:DUF4340 domain-containing protein [Oscillospiraceae bacterium]
MSKKIKSLIISAAGLMVLVALTVIIMIVQREDPLDNIPPEPEPDTRIHFAQFTPEEVVSISVKNEQGEYTIERRGDDVLSVPALYGAHLNYSRLHNSARYASELWAREIVAENVEALYQYGLEDTAAIGLITFANGETLEIYVGDKTPTPEDMTYVRVIRDGSKDTVYAVWSYLVDWIKESPLFYASLDVTISFMDAGWPRIDRFVIDRAGHEQYVIELIPRLDEEEVIINSHRLLAPVEVEVDHNKGDWLTHGLFGLTAEEVVFVGRELPGNIANLFDEAELIATVTLNGRESTLIIGDRYFTQDEDGEEVFAGYYGVHSDHPDVVFIFSRQTLHNLLTFDVESIMASMFHRPLIYTVSELIIETPLHFLNFTLTGEDRNDEAYYLNGERTDTNAFKDVYIYALMASAETLFKGEAEDIYDMQLLARYTYKYRDDSPETVIEFFDSGDMRSVIAINGEPRFTTRIGYLTRLEQNLELYINNEAIINSW